MAESGSSSSSRSPRGGRRKLWIGLSAALAVAVAAGGFAVWYFVFRDTAPPTTSIERAARSVQDSTATTSSASSASGSSTLDGTWTVDKTVGKFDVNSNTFTSAWAGYRVREELAGFGAKVAVGRTPDVTGTLVISGTSATKVDIVVNTTTLRSDDDRRDGAIGMQALETRRFPQARFSLTQPIAFGAVADGQTVSVRAAGDLTLHGVTRSVTIPLDAKRIGSTIVVTGQLDVAFADYGIAKPSSLNVLSVEDKGVMELQLFFKK
jgi:polyisoprenoid-binding protein YceI